MAMITSEENPPWPLDCTLTDIVAAGLPAPSKVRFKLFTFDHRLVRGELGKLAPADSERMTVQECARDLLAVLDAAKVERAVLVAHSMGVQVVLDAWKRARSSESCSLTGGNPG